MTLVLAWSPSWAVGAERTLFIGTYTRGSSEGIYRTTFDDVKGSFSDPVLAAKAENPSFLAVSPKRDVVYAVNEVSKFQDQKTGAVSAYRLGKDGSLQLLNQTPSGGSGPCHLSVSPDGRHVLVANYGAGTLAVIPVLEDGGLGHPTQLIQHEGSSINPRRQEGPHAHSIDFSPDGRFVAASDLGIDEVKVYAWDAGEGLLRSLGHAGAKALPGAGPRHLAFHLNGKWAFGINELHSTITSYSQDGSSGKLTPLASVSTLPKGHSGMNTTTAEIYVHPNGRFVYGSNRGHDSIAVFQLDPETGLLTLVEHEPCGGQTPRHFRLEPSGRWLLTANQGSGNLASFEVDGETGKLRATGNQAKVDMPVCLLFVD